MSKIFSGRSMLPRVSVVTVVKNAANVIEATIDSVLGQDYPDVEYMVVDGGSTDGTTAIVERYRARISVFVSEPDSGVYSAMRKGVQRSKGEMILLLNAGDVFVDSSSLSSLVRGRLASRLEGPAICYSDYMKFYPKLDRAFMIAATGNLEQGMGLCHQAMLADRSAYVLVGDFNPEFRLAADYEWVLRAKKAGVHFLKVSGPPVAVFRQGGLSDSQYRLSRAEAAMIIRREYGWPAYARYIVTQRWRFCLRVGSGIFGALFGDRAANWLYVAYLRNFRGHHIQAFDPRGRARLAASGFGASVSPNEPRAAE